MLALILPLCVALGASATGSAGCGTNPPDSGSYTIRSGGLTRKYIVNVPSAYDEDVAAPLILSFHGNGKTAASQEDLSDFDDEGWNPDAISVYPQGVKDKWQGTPYSDPKIDDIAFVEDLLDHLEATYCIDTERIWATVKSIGGGFCNVLACSALISTRIAAFAPVSGAFYIDNAPDNSDCDPPRAVTPILEFHGLADTTIAYTGGPHKGGNLPKILDWAAHWAARNECKEDPVITLLNAGSVKHYVWGCAGSATQHYAIAGLGHDWPSIEPNDDNPKGTVIDATPIIMEFFNQHSL